jgi:hypothetical protein
METGSSVHEISRKLRLGVFGSAELQNLTALPSRLKTIPIF